MLSSMAGTPKAAAIWRASHSRDSSSIRSLGEMVSDSSSSRSGGRIAGAPSRCETGCTHCACRSPACSGVSRCVDFSATRLTPVEL